jgi:hypothetical protein
METTFAALWPNEPFPENIGAFTEKIEGVEGRLTEWRESAARVATDEALSWIVSIYETINLDKIVGCRVNSKWVTDPELAEKRTRKAYEIVSRSNIHEYAFSIDTPRETIEAAQKLAEEAEAKRRRIEENRYKNAEDDPTRFRRRSGKDVAEDEVSEDQSSDDESEGEGGESTDEELEEDEGESSAENFDTEEEAPSDPVDEDILADPVLPANNAKPTRPSGAKTATPSGSKTATPSGSKTAGTSGGTSTAPSGNAPPSPSAAS